MAGMELPPAIGLTEQNWAIHSFSIKAHLDRGMPSSDRGSKGNGPHRTTRFK